MKYQVLYDKEKERINKLLKKSLDRQPSDLYSPAYFVIKNGGKRLRPLLVLFSCKAVGGKYSNAYNAAAAVELLHNFTLVHDDIMDNADKRRGVETLHVKHDLSTAILAGDSMLAVAYEYLLKDFNGKSRILSEFTTGLIEVCEGQSLDKMFETENKVTLDDYIEMVDKKTAAMLVMCCRIGAILGNGTELDIKALSRFGRNIGIAFQIQDDLLDVLGYEEFGKTTGGDLMEGKKTFLLLRGLNKAKGKDKKDLKRLIANKGISQSEVGYYTNLYIRNGIIEDAENEIRKYTGKAVKALDDLKRLNDKFLFYWLADSLIKRNK